MYRAIFGLLVVATLSFSESASADWQGTVWGMSMEEADKNFRVPHKKGVPWPRYSGALDFDYTTGNIVFERGQLHFDQYGLTLITMSLRNREQCDSLFDTYHKIYGNPDPVFGDIKVPYNAPSYDLPEYYMRSATWHDESHNNLIRLIYNHGPIELERGCFVYYSALHQPPPPKLVPAPNGL